MRTILTLTAALAIAAPALAVPTFAEAQSSRSYGRGDICRQEKKSAGNKGTITGGLIGGALGAVVAGKGAKTEGALLGGTVGAIAGNQIAKNNVRCSDYPDRISSRRDNCRWVQEYYGGSWHSFEVCRNRNGEWRPSGRG
ncbi:glycine zipper 2TM domain-containing protein [Caulobacter mirabilis]|uniref:glycine zipper 2TM domain-containing protein n=1 Tax=Caulobacter mirabilis TaxID=69666 RepID=UPI001FE41373|nr:glycine zipper 2TM domain-containing protein [Caulobacter mirabilis]